ncbi:MAG: hypothetical protein LQ344_004876 [Seirophora lacunosa]|nr:MAG: hypothetical protein LQ344_004876 [Seirophora lacunosa]
MQELAVNIFFGIFAAAASLVTLWQGHRLWRTMRQAAVEAQGRDHGEAGMPTPIELSTLPATPASTASNSRSSTIDTNGAHEAGMPSTIDPNGA